jgi:apolipoprotein D and lipocalin family protein
MMRITLLSILILLTLVLWTGCATSIPPEMSALLVDKVDLTRYTGLWYQVARYPHSFQRGECGDSTAEYSLREDGRIDVLNRCWEGEYGGAYSQQVRAVGTPMDDRGSWLRVVFFRLFPAAYLVIELDQEHYQWAAVTTADRNSLWILSRTPALDEETFERIITSLEGKGFSRDRIIRTSQQ